MFAGYPAPAESRRSSGPGRLPRLMLLVGALASVGYAVWAMTARRGIFVDFVDNRYVSLSRARTSDRLDTTFLVIAGVLAVVGLGVWLVRLAAGRAHGGALAVAGFVVAGAGIVCVVVGLVLAGLVTDSGDRIAEGHKAVTATLVIGSGFLALAVGLVIGLLVVNRRDGSQTGQTGHTGESGDSGESGESGQLSATPLPQW
jgi:hypothetical protein